MLVETCIQYFSINCVMVSCMHWLEYQIEFGLTYVHSYSFQRSTHSKGSGQMTLAHGLLDGQFLSKFLAIVAWPHCVPFIAGGSGKCLPSNLDYLSNFVIF